jgi:hypothetical protein
VSSAEAAVEVGAREVEVTLCRGDDHTLGAGHASSQILSDCAATVAETKLVAADANNSAVIGARSALAVRRCGVVRHLRGGRRCSRWDRLRSWDGRLGHRGLWLSSRSRSGSRRSTRSEDTTWVDRGR